ncbi:MAG: CtsR family transcriptional regulator [Clostridia bacterium]|nr:CtsR family transcriptional regulator [Clostridia bacterium]MBR6795348.1 CtsR family transcriptional regulator [Clostridia bacterium]
MIISDNIARMIEELIEESGGTIELKRNVMAEQIGCAPSQINYVIMSRFTPERGYLTESRRGGGGFIRIVKKPLHRNVFLVQVIESIGARLEESDCAAILRTLKAHNAIDAHDVDLIAVALSAPSLAPISSKKEQSEVRAVMMRRFLTALMQ